MKPTLSICIPTYNRAGPLRESLESILPQVAGSPDVEVVVSDNASTDNTGDICRDFQTRYSFIRYLPNPENLGFDGNIVACVQKAQGEYVAFFSDDDLAPPGTFAGLLSHLRKSKPSLLQINFRPFFHDNPQHTEAPRAPVTTKIFTSGKEFLNFAGAAGLISALTVRTEDARRFLGSVVAGRGTAHLDISTRIALLCKGPFVYDGNLMVLARCEYSPRYDMLTFGIMHVTRLYLDLQRESLLPAEDVRRQIRSQVLCLPRNIVSNRSRSDGIVRASALRELYGKDPLFYLLVFPLLILPPPLLRFTAYGLRSIVHALRRIRHDH